MDILNAGLVAIALVVLLMIALAATAKILNCEAVMDVTWRRIRFWFRPQSRNRHR